MHRPRLLVFAVALTAITAIAVVGALSLSSPSNAPIAKNEGPATPARQAPSPVSPSTPAPVSPVVIASVPAATPATPAIATAPAAAVHSLEAMIGTVQPVAGDANPAVRSVVSALQEKNHPERLSALVAPQPFDPVAYQADPVAFAQTVEPGRALQSAQPGPNVPVLRPLGTTQLTMTQESRVILRLKTQPNAPVTFTSFDLGRFSNNLVSQTVIADANGVAATEFFAGPGTIDGVHVLAASPVASGQVRFDIQVLPAKGQSLPAGG